jgi:hypothetical protein
MTTKTIMVPKQPPPNFKAPYPDNSPLNRLFILTLVDLECEDGDKYEHVCYRISEIYYMISTFPNYEAVNPIETAKGKVHLGR